MQNWSPSRIEGEFPLWIATEIVYNYIVNCTGEFAIYLVHNMNNLIHNYFFCYLQFQFHGFAFFFD